MDKHRIQVSRYSDLSRAQSVTHAAMYLPVASRSVAGTQYSASFAGSDKRFAMWTPAGPSRASDLVVIRLGIPGWTALTTVLGELEAEGWHETLRASTDDFWLNLVKEISRIANL